MAVGLFQDPEVLQGRNIDLNIWSLGCTVSFPVRGLLSSVNVYLLLTRSLMYTGVVMWMACGKMFNDHVLGLPKQTDGLLFGVLPFHHWKRYYVPVRVNITVLLIKIDLGLGYSVTFFFAVINGHMFNLTGKSGGLYTASPINPLEAR